MITVADVLPDVQRVLGGVDRATGLGRLNDAVDVLANESEWSPSRGYMDILVTTDSTGGTKRVITLPREVGTILAVNIGGHPTQAHNFWFRYHLNGPGDSCRDPISGFHWVDDLVVPVYQDPNCNTGDLLECTLETALDNNVIVRAYGYDASNNWIRTPDATTHLLVDGWVIPTIYGAPAVNPDAPRCTRLVRVSLGAHVGKITLNIKNADATLTAIGQYYAADTEPQYRRVRLGIGASGPNDCQWVRVAFKKSSDILANDGDLIPLHSKYAVIMMVKALMKLDADRIEEAAKYQLMAVSYLNKKQESLDPPGGPGIQMSDINLLADRHDRMS